MAIKKITATQVNNSLLILFLFLFSTNILAQDTYKVVCDKTDKTIKVIKSKDTSPNYVPIKGGFPFQQIAQQWIDNNYTSKKCDPENIVKIYKTEENNVTNTSVSNQTNLSTQSASSSISTTQEPRYRNTSFLLNGKVSNLGDAFSINKGISSGFNIGFEHLFGKKYYVGIGIDMNFYFTDFSSPNNISNQITFFFGKIPLFFGVRTNHKKFIFMYELGGEYNTEFRVSDDDFEFYDMTPKNNSFDIMGRFRFGTERIMLSLGSELWITSIFENNNYKMSVIYLGMKLNF